MFIVLLENFSLYKATQSFLDFTLKLKEKIAYYFFIDKVTI